MENIKRQKEFAKLRYRFGVYIQLIALIFIIIFQFIGRLQNITEMKANPAEYAEEKIRCYVFVSHNTTK